jgi:uncharacterized protein (TIGR03084 family)
VPDLNDLCDDLAAEHAALDLLLEPLDAVAWTTPTPAEGWTIRDQIAHLYFGDNRALLTATDPAAFLALRDIEYVDKTKFAAAMVGPELGTDGPSVYAAWKRERAAFVATYRQLDPKVRVEWYGPPMSPLSKVTARIMETWAHGQDVADALGATREPTERLRHIAHIGVGARRFSYTINGLDVDETPVFVELAAPSGATWTWGDPAAAAHDLVRGSALDFCLLVVRRRHLADTALVADGPAAAAWLPIAQAYAGPGGTGRAPGQFSTGTAPARLTR